MLYIIDWVILLMFRSLHFPCLITSFPDVTILHSINAILQRLPVFEQCLHKNGIANALSRFVHLCIQLLSITEHTYISRWQNGRKSRQLFVAALASLAERGCAYTRLILGVCTLCCVYLMSLREEEMCVHLAERGRVYTRRPF